MAPLKTPQFAPEVDPQVEITRKKVAHVMQPEDQHVTKSVSREQPFLLDGDFLLVTNVSDTETYSFRWARKFYIVAPGESKHVIFEALVDALGDPRSMDNEVVVFNDGNGSRGIIMERHNELSRLFGKYAVENERLDDTWDEKTQKMEPGLLTMTPDVVCETMNGQHVTFPGLRPDMLPFPVPQVDEKNINVDTTKVLDRLAAENDELREQNRINTERLDALYAEREGVAQGS